MRMCDIPRLSYRWLYTGCWVLVSCFLPGCVLGGMGVACSSHSLGRGGASIEGVCLHLQGGNPLATPLPKRGRVRSLCQRPQRVIVAHAKGCLDFPNGLRWPIPMGGGLGLFIMRPCACARCQIIDWKLIFTACRRRARNAQRAN